MYRNVRVVGAPPRLSGQLVGHVCGVLKAMHAHPSVELRFHVVGMRDMAAVNFHSRGIAAPTDVLTFPGPGSATEPSSRIDDLLFSGGAVRHCSATSAMAEMQSMQLRRWDSLDLGDVYMCPPYVLGQCARNPRKNLPLGQYSVAAVIHAVLHALGYDHDSEERLAVMARLERRVCRHLMRQRSLGRLDREIGLSEYTVRASAEELSLL